MSTLRLIIYYSLRVVTSIVGIVAGLLGAMHGYFEILQRNVAVSGVLIDAKTGRSVFEWSSLSADSEPALTIVPNLLATGILAILMSTFIIVWAVAFVHKRNAFLVLILSSCILCLFGGGFLPPLIGIVGGIIGIGIRPSEIRKAE